MSKNQNYQVLKKLTETDTEGRRKIILKELDLRGVSYDECEPPLTGKIIYSRFPGEADKELWLNANYDTFKNYPAANNNASSVITLLMLSERLKSAIVPFRTRILYFDGGLDTSLIEHGKRDPNFKPTSEYYLDYLLENDIEFIDYFLGSITLQAIGKGTLEIYGTSGKKHQNSTTLNNLLKNYSKKTGVSLNISNNSPLADNVSFLKLGLESTVLSRYDEKAWKKMQTPRDDMSNITINSIIENINFLEELIRQLGGKI